ncbi:cupin domain-containing protein [Lacihabitans sp. LS3-19]|uniref:cupin domain-containing protein n=1 Tax=Lacihabitans sp. LS3-19 TaxID=2487335 RepID=UPI0020CCBFBF|nr:cupin domain-containing protein [Lacihabitans sp. LS3-19]MCP9768965.1 cupin domain-containing protein [Lacihabitans sp. LS3-19]
MQNVNITEKLSLFSDYWNPKIVGELNGQHVKLVKLKGEFVWHSHENEDEMFYVLNGTLEMEFRDKTVSVNQNEFIIVPKGVEHRPVAKEEVSIMLFEPATTLNTGDAESNELTRNELEKI